MKLFGDGDGRDGWAPRGSGTRPRGAQSGEKRGGGPKSPAGLARVSQNLEAPGLARVSHGVYRFLGSDGALAPPCKRCIYKDRCSRYEEDGTCVVAEEYQEELRGELCALEHILPQDGIAVNELVKAATALGVLDQYLAETGPFLPGLAELTAQPALVKLRGQLSRQMIDLCKELGLTPRARAAMNLGSGQGPLARIAAAIAEAEGQEASGDIDCQEGEFDVGEAESE